MLAEIANELGLIAMHRMQGEPAGRVFSRAIYYGIAGNYPRIHLLRAAMHLGDHARSNAILAHLQAVDQTCAPYIAMEVVQANGDFARMLELADALHRQLVGEASSDHSPYILVDALCHRARAHAGLLQVEAAVADYAACVALIEHELGASSPALAEPLLHWSLLLADQPRQQMGNLQRIARLATANGVYPAHWAASLRQVLHNVHDRGSKIDEATAHWVAQMLALP